MSNNIIQIDKGKYTALLRRVLGMQLSENGVSELQTLGSIVNYVGRNFQDEALSAEQACSDIETLEFVAEYFHLRKDEMLYAKYELTTPAREYRGHEDTTFG